MDTGQLSQVLADRVDGEVRFDPGTRGAYAHDGSNYRQLPLGVVVPRSADAAAAAIGVCAEFGAPVLSRGGGTSLAGQCCNTAVVIDWTKYCHQVISVDPGGRTAIVQPGAALDKVNDAVRKYGLMVGPKPSTHVSCTIGGMIGNNSCGSTAQAYGKMADSVRRLEILTYDGLRTWTGLTSDVDYEQIVAAGGRKADIYRAPACHPGQLPGPDQDPLPGHPAPRLRLQPGLPAAGEAVPRGAGPGRQRVHAGHRAARGDRAGARSRSSGPWSCSATPTSPRPPTLVRWSSPTPRSRCEGLDDVLISLEREEHLAGQALDKLPEGSGWLMVQFGGDTQDEADDRAQALIDAAQADGDHPKPHVAYLDDPAVEDELWTGPRGWAWARPPTRRASTRPTRAGRTPPSRPSVSATTCGTSARCWTGYDYHGSSLYGHFGQGCVHTRIPFELRTAEGIAAYRSFVEEAADLVVSLRRLAVRRARRRPVPGRAAAQDVRSRADPRLRRDEGRSSTRTTG